MNTQSNIKPNFKRTEDGRPDIHHGDCNVVAADAIALLSGVNFSTVERVLAALHVIQDYSDTEAGKLIDLGAVPLKRVQPEDRGDIYRAVSTRTFFENLIASGRYRSYQNVLPRIDKTQSRYGPHRGPEIRLGCRG